MHGGYAVVWSAAATGAGGTSSSFDARLYPFVSAFGSCNGATTVTLQYSHDNATYYDGPTQALSGAGDFRLDAISGAPFHRLKSSANVTATAVIAGKP